jgi:selenocysteine lyase/cysteine desulfurase
MGENSNIWSGIRSQFELDPEYVHLSLPILAAHPKPVREAIEAHRKGLDRNPFLYYLQKDKFNNEALEAAAQYLRTEPNLIALTESSTMGFGMIYSGLQLQPGDEVLISPYEHYSAHEALRFRSIRTPISIKTIDLYKNAEAFSADEALHSILSGISANTRVIALTWVHSGTGVKFPIQRVTQAVSQINEDRSPDKKILTIVDGVHGFGIEPLQVEEMGCDFFITSCHKWLCGPRGTGLIWGKKESWNLVCPVIPSYDGEAFLPWVRGVPIQERDCPPARLCNPGGFQAFENRWALPAAFKFHQEIGLVAIRDHVQNLAQYCKARMQGIPNVHVHTPMSADYSLGFVSFDVVGKTPPEVIHFFQDRKILISQTPYVRTHARFAWSMVNTYEEVDKTIQCLKDCAALETH